MWSQLELNSKHIQRLNTIRQHCNYIWTLLDIWLNLKSGLLLLWKPEEVVRLYFSLHYLKVKGHPFILLWFQKEIVNKKPWRVAFVLIGKVSRVENILNKQENSSTCAKFFYFIFCFTFFSLICIVAHLDLDFTIRSVCCWI